MVAEPAAWKVRVGLRVLSAEGHVRDAHEGLVNAKGFFEMAVPPEILAEGYAAGLHAIRVKLVFAMAWLMVAAQYLNYAVASMDAAEILALHGGSLDHVSLPLQSIHHLHPQQAPLQAALGLLQVSRVMLKDTCDSTEWCRGHLSTMMVMVENPAPIPFQDAMDYALQEQNTACHALADATHRTEAAWVEVTNARQILLHP